METPTSYCEAVSKMTKDDLHRRYHDHQYGFPIESDDELFGRLLLEMNQAGLSWSTILKKQDHFRKAYANYSIPKVASFGEADRHRLLNDAGIIRNRLKVDAAIHNAKVILGFQKEYGSFKNWLDQHHPMKKDAWVKLFKQIFRFTGGEITNEFLVSTGYLEGAHLPSCPIYQKVLASQPPWLNKQ